MSRPGQILLLSCYELGHQPLNLGWPTAVLQEAGFQVQACDLAVDALPAAAAREAALVAIAVPMHTALRLGVEAAQQVRAHNPAAHINFYGLYAWLNQQFLLAGDRPVADSVTAGEVEAVLADLARTLLQGGSADRVPGVSTAGRRAEPVLQRLQLPVPDRSQLRPLDSYARIIIDGEARLAGYTEASRGCLHTCTHCPVVPVYQGRFFVIPVETVLADVAQQVAAGARHITFGDPDFLNGPGHALRAARALHAAFPDLTFDFTTKVEHLLERAALLPELRALGAAFVISAFESVTPKVLQRLEKGHSVADMEAALALLAAADLPVQPTWVPFTPWGSLDNFLELLQWIRRQDLVPNVPLVQLAVRLLIPPDSQLLHQPDVTAWLGPLDATNFSYRWRHADPRVDLLQRQIVAYAERTTVTDPYAAFAEVEALAYRMADRPPPPAPRPAFARPLPPRLTEDWFC